MLCDKCKKNNAVTHIKTNINGIMYEQHLCEDCARAEGLTNSYENPFEQFFDSFFGQPQIIKRTSKNCPGCKTSFDEILSTGRIGCSECYNAFQNELLPYIKKLQGNVVHKGKQLEYTESKSENTIKSTEIDTLKKQLAEAVETERYEDAAILRDKINKLKEGK